MSYLQQDLAILEKFNFDIKPVAASFLIRPPEKILRLEKKMTFCQMIRRAQEAEPFYVDSENHTCEVGPFILGGQEVPPPFFSGGIWGGAKTLQGTAGDEEGLSNYSEAGEERRELRCLFHGGSIVH